MIQGHWQGGTVIYLSVFPLELTLIWQWITLRCFCFANWRCKKNKCCFLSCVPSSTLLTCSWLWPTSSSFWWTVIGTNRCCVKLVSTNGCCCAAAMPWAMKTTLCTLPYRGCLRGWLHRPCSQWHSGTSVGKHFLLDHNTVALSNSVSTN